MTTFELSKQLQAHNGEVRCGCSIRNGRFVTGGFDASCCVWTAEGNLEKQIYGHSDFVYAVSSHPFNPDWFVSGSKDRSIFIHDSVSGEKILGLDPIHQGPVCSLSVYGTLLAAGSWDGSISIWNLETTELVRHIQNAGSHAVTVGFHPTSGFLLSGSQDKSLKMWNSETGDLINEIQNAHDDIIRSISCDADMIVTCSNDGSIKIWSSHDMSLLGTLHGHENFVFSVDRKNSEIVSCGEDRTVRIWNVDSSLTSQQPCQIIRHPGTVWFAKFVQSGRLVTGCADGFVRIFSTDPSEYAGQEERDAFNAISAPPEAEQVDPSTVPLESEMNRWSGKKVGEVKMFKDIHNTVFAYQWSADRSWEKVGLVTGGGASKKPKIRKQYGGDQYFPAGEYDYLFDVELGESRMALLPFNNGDNPLIVAEKFCAREVINKANISQIIDFIKTNTSTPTQATSPPASATSKSTSTHFPLLTPFLFKDAKWEQLVEKLKQVNSSIPDPLSVDEMVTIASIVNTLQQPPSHLSQDFRPAEISLVHSKLLAKIPPESVFVVFDLWRLFVLHSSAAVMYKDSDGGSQFMITAAKYLQSSVLNNTGLCAARFLANLFASSVSKWAAVDRNNLFMPQVFEALATPGLPKNSGLALASIVANLANTTTEKKTAKSIALAESLVESIYKVMGKNVFDQDVMYRLLVGLGSARIGTNSDAGRDKVQQLISTIDRSNDLINQLCLEL
jgi:phospholipase A-2-activating protein